MAIASNLFGSDNNLGLGSICECDEGGGFRTDDESQGGWHSSTTRQNIRKYKTYLSITGFYPKSTILIHESY